MANQQQRLAVIFKHCRRKCLSVKHTVYHTYNAPCVIYLFVEISLLENRIAVSVSSLRHLLHWKLTLKPCTILHSVIYCKWKKYSVVVEW